MLDFDFKPIWVAVCISLMSVNASATLLVNKTVLNKTDQATVVAHFDTTVKGDLYVATQINGQLNFIADQGKTLTTEVKAFQLNGTFSSDVKILDVTALNITPGQYPLYEVISFAGTDPLNFMNWVGGLSGLNRLNFSIGLPVSTTNDLNGDGFADDDSNHNGFRDDDHNISGSIDACNGTLAASGKKGHDDDDDNHHNRVITINTNNTVNNGNCSPVITTKPTPATPIKPTTTVTTTNTSTTGTTGSTATSTDTSQGKALYVSLTCSAGGCHTANPAANRNGILKGRSLSQIKSAIVRLPGDMGFLSSTSDADLQAVADYLKTF